MTRENNKYQKPVINITSFEYEDIITQSICPFHEMPCYEITDNYDAEF